MDRYCDLAKVSRDSLKFAATPFHDTKIARAIQEGEPGGRLQPIASKVLMKVLFAARMARWDLLRATQSLASRVTKWSRGCDTALHRLICYINSSLGTYMQGFIGDKIGDCKLWLFCDADWAGEHDSKSTSGCALFLVGPNTYYPLITPFLRNKPPSRCQALNQKSFPPIMVFGLRDCLVLAFGPFFGRRFASLRTARCVLLKRSRLVALVCVFTNSLFRLWFFPGEKQKILFFEKFLMLDFICIFKSAA